MNGIFQIPEFLVPLTGTEWIFTLHISYVLYYVTYRSVGNHIARKKYKIFCNPLFHVLFINVKAYLLS